MRGLQLTADLRGCDATRPAMTDAAALRAMCLGAVERSGLRAVGDLFHAWRPAPGSDDAAPAGITGVVLLAESHLAVHTWPEVEAATVDVYVCNLGVDNSAAAETLFATLLAAFSPAETARTTQRRG